MPTPTKAPTGNPKFLFSAPTAKTSHHCSGVLCADPLPSSSVLPPLLSKATLEPTSALQNENVWRRRKKDGAKHIRGLVLEGTRTRVRERQEGKAGNYTSQKVLLKGVGEPYFARYLPSPALPGRRRGTGFFQCGNHPARGGRQQLMPVSSPQQSDYSGWAVSSGYN